MQARSIRAARNIDVAAFAATDSYTISADTTTRNSAILDSTMAASERMDKMAEEMDEDLHKFVYLSSRRGQYGKIGEEQAPLSPQYDYRPVDSPTRKAKAEPKTAADTYFPSIYEPTSPAAVNVRKGLAELMDTKLEGSK